MQKDFVIKKKKQKQPTIIEQQATGFIDFIRERGVMSIALGLVLAGVVTKVVTSFMTDIVSPILGILLGKTTSLQYLSITIFDVKISYGNFLAVFIDALVVILVLYILFRLLGLEKLDKKK